MTEPSDVIWDMTYACPLRCTHCYSESGRRPTRQLGRDDLLRIIDAIISLRPGGIALSGGEPLLVPGVFEVAERTQQAGIPTDVYTSGAPLRPWMIDEVARLFDRVVVSVDGATAMTHDRIRGRAGSFDGAMAALALLDRKAQEQRARGERPVRFGIDCVVLRSNFDQLDRFCTDVVPRFTELEFLWFGAAVPSGLASRVGFELVSDEQARQLADGGLAARLGSLAPPSVRVGCTDNRALQMHPERVANGTAFRAMQIEPDGEVRAMAIYEGTVGNIRTESAADLWRRAVERWSDPFVTSTLGAVHTMADWAEAARRIDYHFGSTQVRARIDRRPVYAGTES